MVVKDVMTTRVVTVKPDDSVEKCARLLQEHNISGLPVVDKDNRVKGVVTEGDLIRRASRIKAPGYLEILGGLIYLGSPKRFVDELQRAMSHEAGQMMSEGVVTVLPTDELEKAATLMLEKEIGRLPVVDEDGVLVGIVSRRDIMSNLYK